MLKRENTFRTFRSYGANSTYRGRGEIGGAALLAGAHTTTLLVMVDTVKGWGRAISYTFTRGCVDLTIMMECTPESGHCHSVYCVVWRAVVLKILG
jgi:hypothetical protein